MQRLQGRLRPPVSGRRSAGGSTSTDRVRACSAVLLLVPVTALGARFVLGLVRRTGAQPLVGAVVSPRLPPPVRVPPVVEGPPEVGPDDAGPPDRLLGHARLAQAIRADELLLHYQPVVGTCGGRVVRVEALVRWQHPARGLLPPADFLPLAQGSGLIDPLTTWVLQRAVADLATMPLGLAVSVNVAPSTLADVGFAAAVAQLLAAAGVRPDRLVLEMTATAIDDVARVRASLERLGALGVCVSLDDVGLGSVLSAVLRSLPFAEVKMHRSRLDAAPGPDPVDAAAVIDTAHEAGMAVVAKGIESAELLEHVRRLGADLAQGHHLGRPEPLVRLSPAPRVGAAPRLPAAVRTSGR